MKKLQSFKSKNFEKEISNDELKKIRGGLRNYNPATRVITGVTLSSIDVADISDTADDCC